MSLLMTLAVAVRALRRNTMRTALTALGMIIGVAAVIVMVAIGAGARASIETQIRSAGSNIVMVNAGSGAFGPVRAGQGAVTTLTPDDAAAIRAEIPGVRYLSPGVNMRTQILSGNSNWGTSISPGTFPTCAIRMCLRSMCWRCCSAAGAAPGSFKRCARRRRWSTLSMPGLTARAAPDYWV